MKKDWKLPNMYLILTNVKDDEHGGSKLRMKAVLGEMFVTERKLSCEFHMEQSVKNHKKYVTKESRVLC